MKFRTLTLLFLAKMSKEFYAELSSDFAKTLNDQENHDLIIYAGEGLNKREFKVHMLVLSTRSNYFRTALSKNWLKKKGEYYFFEKPNVEPDVFEIILR